MDLDVVCELLLMFTLCVDDTGLSMLEITLFDIAEMFSTLLILRVSCMSEILMV